MISISPINLWWISSWNKGPEMSLAVPTQPEDSAKPLPQSFQGRSTIGWSWALGVLAAKGNGRDVCQSRYQCGKSHRSYYGEASLSMEGKTAKHLISAKGRHCPEDEVYCLNPRISTLAQTPRGSSLVSWWYVALFLPISQYHQWAFKLDVGRIL